MRDGFKFDQGGDLKQILKQLEEYLGMLLDVKAEADNIMVVIQEEFKYSKD